MNLSNEKKSRSKFICKYFHVLVDGTMGIMMVFVYYMMGRYSLDSVKFSVCVWGAHTGQPLKALIYIELTTPKACNI